ncbi:hypothetical protein [Streptomyces avermitilis]
MAMRRGVDDLAVCGLEPQEAFQPERVRGMAVTRLAHLSAYK